VAHRILFVLTSHSRIGDTGKPTGVWLEELAEPYWMLRDAGAEVTLASIRGGQVPVDPGSVAEPGRNAAPVDRFLADPATMAELSGTVAVEGLRAGDFDAVFLPGGHGTMWDLPESRALAGLLSDAWAGGRVVAAVCHGPAGLVNARTPDGAPLVRGRRVAAFTDAEEEAAGLAQAVPFLLETRLRELGAELVTVPNWQPNAVRDGALVTGQNPASSAGVARLMLETLGAGGTGG